MPSRRALLIGINRYPHLSPLQQLFGAVHDAEELADVLEQRFAFTKENLQLLRDEDATRVGVLSRLDALIDAGEPGDLLLFQWSGHGSQCPARFGEDHVDEPDGLAETLVPFDSARGRDEVRDILDDEIRLRLADLERRRVFVTLILDCCHSGHVYRMAGPRTRSAPAATRRPPTVDSEQLLPGPRGRLRQGSSRLVVLSACRDEERAGERPIYDDEPATTADARPAAHGHFTWSLLRELRSGDGTESAGEIFRRARARMLAETARQTPQLAGAAERLLFGTEARASRPWVRVGRPTRHERSERADDLATTIEMAAGAGQGIEKHSVWSIHRAGSEHPESTQRIALAEVHQVAAFRSRAWIVHGDPASVRPDDRAYLYRAARGEARLPVGLVSDCDGAAALAAEASGIETSPYLRRVSADAQDPDLVRVHLAGAGLGQRFQSLGRLVGDSWVLCDNCDEPFALVPRSPRADGVAALRPRLERRARCRQGLRVENPDDRSRPAGLELRLLSVPGGGALDQDPAGLPTFRRGDRLAFEVCHQHEVPLYLYVLDFGLTDRVSQLFPLAGAEEALDPGRRHRVGVALGDEIDLDLPDDFDSPLAPDWRREGGIEHLVLFATSRATNFRPLCTGDDPPMAITRSAGSLASWIDVRRPAVSRSDHDVWHTVRAPFRLLR